MVTPPDEVPSLASFRRLERTSAKAVPIDLKLVREWQEATAREAAAKGEKEAALAYVLQQLGDAEVGECWGVDDAEEPVVIGRFTYFEQFRNAYTVQATSYRVPRWKSTEKKPARRKN